jgi:hypothetical protein
MRKLVLAGAFGIALFAASETMAQYELMQFVTQRNVLMLYQLAVISTDVPSRACRWR